MEKRGQNALKRRTGFFKVIHSMVYLRNLCSHHCRLWHREMIIRPPKIRDIAREFPKFSTAPQESVAASLNALMYLVTKIEGERKYADDLAEFISEDTKYEDGMTTPLHWR